MRKSSESDSPEESEGIAFGLCERAEAFEEEGTGTILAAAHASLMEEFLFLVWELPNTIFCSLDGATGS